MELRRAARVAVAQRMVSFSPAHYKRLAAEGDQGINPARTGHAVMMSDSAGSTVRTVGEATISCAATDALRRPLS
jgi:hypothetical protein